MTNSNAKRQTILETAYRLFRVHGFDGTSMSEIAAVAGGSKATLYSHFSSKEELFVECMTTALEDYLTGAITQLDSAGAVPGAALKELGEILLSFASSPEMVAVRRLVIAESGRSGLGKQFHAKIVTLRTHVADILASFMARGTLRPGDAGFAASQLRALLEAEVLEPLLLHVREDPPDEREIALTVDRAVTSFLRAYAPAEK